MKDKAGNNTQEEIDTNAEAEGEVDVEGQAAGLDADTDTESEAVDADAAGGKPEPEAGAGAESDEVIISFGEPSPGSDDEPEESENFRAVRQAHREARREAQALRHELQQLRTSAVAQPEPLGAKPTLESCEYDTARFEAALNDWHQRKLVHDNQAQTQQREAEAQQQAFAERVKAYGQQKAELKVRDFADAESTVTEALSLAQQGILLTGADAPAQLVYALGRSPEKLKELKAIKDPVKFAFAVAKLETQMKVTPRKAPPAPERRVTGGAPIRSSEQALAKLEAEAERTGDRSKVIAYKRQLRAQQQ